MTSPPPEPRRKISPALVLSAIVALVAVIALLRGHDATPPPAAPSQVASAPAAMELTIPKLGVESSLIGLGLNRDGSLAVPSLNTPMQASWYTGSPTPGDRGPAVVLGHVDAYNKLGVFFRLNELRPGDQATVRRADGSVATFTVTFREEVPKNKFPAQQVYGNTPGPELRLITCGGSFDHVARSYRDNIVVFAKLTSLSPPAH